MAKEGDAATTIGDSKHIWLEYRADDTAYHHQEKQEERPTAMINCTSQSVAITSSQAIHPGAKESQFVSVQLPDFWRQCQRLWLITGFSLRASSCAWSHGNCHSSRQGSCGQRQFPWRQKQEWRERTLTAASHSTQLANQHCLPPTQESSQGQRITNWHNIHQPTLTSQWLYPNWHSVHQSILAGHTNWHTSVAGSAADRIVCQ